jgi:hypothetical protein
VSLVGAACDPGALAHTPALGRLLKIAGKIEESLAGRFIIEVGLEPTTLRLTASEFPSPSPAIVCCKSLYKSKLEKTASTVHRYRYCLIATDFERAWAQKWVQSFQSIGIAYTRRYKSKMRAIFRVTGTKPALKRCDPFRTSTRDDFSFPTCNLE